MTEQKRRNWKQDYIVAVRVERDLRTQLKAAENAKDSADAKLAPYRDAHDRLRASLGRIAAIKHNGFMQVSEPDDTGAYAIKREATREDLIVMLSAITSAACEALDSIPNPRRSF